MIDFLESGSTSVLKEDAIYEDGGGRMAEGRTARGGEPRGKTAGGGRRWEDLG